jgi:HD-GYP domain-containing protein (c-di-GMP phosphodiesterase class II)
MYRDSVVADSDRKRSSTSAASTQSALDRDLDERITRPASSLFQSFSPPTECCKGQMVVFAILPLRYAAPFPLINPGRPQFCFAFHARDYPRVAHPSEGGVQRTLTFQFNDVTVYTVYHEGLLLSDALESEILPHAVRSDIASMQGYIDSIVTTRQVNDIEINVIQLTEPGRSRIVASNNRGNIGATDDQEHQALEEALLSTEPFIEIEKNIFDIDPDDDVTTYSDPEHPDYYFPPGFRIVSITTPLIAEGTGWGSINIDLSLAYLDRRLRRSHIYIAASSLVGISIVVILMVMILTRRLFNPLWNLSQAMYHFGTGRDVDLAVPTDRKDEIGVLHSEFFSMAYRIAEAEERNREYRDHLEELVDARTKELTLTQEATILSMASLAETRDPETGGHIRRTQRYIRVIAAELRRNSRFSHLLSPESVDLICKSAPLHDIGKVGVPDGVLLKPGKLTAEEFEEMKRHTVNGRDALLAAEAILGSNSFLRFAREIAYTHQEKWDGTGYPQGLVGEQIPISGRLMAVADVYDALISRRVYKEPFSHDKAVCIIRDGRGTHFDPDMVDAFLVVEQEVKKIALELVDSEEERIALCRPNIG